MKRAAAARTLEPKTLTLLDVAAYLGLGSPQAAERWLRAHQILIFQDRLGYNRAYVREIDAANLRSSRVGGLRIRRKGERPRRQFSPSSRGLPK
jgi:hypothetical protein